MNTFKNVVKRFRVAKILIACLAGMILFVNTACSQPTVGSSQLNSAQPASHPSKEKNVKFGDNFPNERTERGMNKYSDVDKGINESDVKAAAKGLRDRADRNLNTKMNNPKEAVETVLNDRPLQKGANKISKDASESVGQATEDLKTIGQRGIKNLKANISGDSSEQASGNVRDLISN